MGIASAYTPGLAQAPSGSVARLFWAAWGSRLHKEGLARQRL